MDIKNITQEEFLKKNRISDEDWDKAEINFEKLKKIGEHHENNKEALNKAAEYIAARLQRFPEVHSVRWRVKDPFHLMEKIVRKRKSKTKKYLEINEENYTEIVTDLIGVRVIHLFKHEWESIHDRLLELWKKKEKPVAYIRSGDEKELTNNYAEKGCKVEVHPAAYRSIHYIISTEATKNKILTEIQVRTIFEEGWSEIDHKIRYPNFTNNENIAYFLKIFNRLAGSADEMGTFINLLSNSLAEQELILNQKNKDLDDHLEKISALMSDLNNFKKSDVNSKKTIEKLNEELQKLKTNTDQYISRRSIVPNNIAGIADIGTLTNIHTIIPNMSSITNAVNVLKSIHMIPTTDYLGRTIINNKNTNDKKNKDDSDA